MQAGKILPVRARMYGSCPFRPGSPHAYLAADLTISALTQASRICHSTGSGNAIKRRTGKRPALCRGARDIQLRFFAAIKFIPAPTDEAWAAKLAEMRAQKKERLTRAGVSVKQPGMKTFIVGLIALCALATLPDTHAADPRRAEPKRGNLTVGDNGTKLNIVKTGRVTLVAGVATVADTDISATTNIFVARQTIGGTAGQTYDITRSAGTSFTITARAADGTTAATSDTSVIAYLILKTD